MENISEIIDKILSSESLINIDGEGIEDLNDFIEIYSDGRWSDRGCKYLYNPKKSQLVCFNWSNWQGEGASYHISDLGKYIDDLMGCVDSEHFDRFVEGLRIIVFKQYEL